MKNWLKDVLIFTAGLAVGGAAGLFVKSKLDEKKLETEIEATREWYEEQLERSGLVNRKDADEPTDPKPDISDSNLESDEGHGEDGKTGDREPRYFSPVDSLTERMNRQKQEIMERAERVRYDKQTKPPDEPEDMEEEVDEVRLAINNDDPATDIYVITPEQFATERLTYDKTDLYWWELERILSEDYDILDVPDLLGYSWEGHIGEFEKDAVYIRNEPMQTDFAVLVQHDSFYAMRDGE